MIRGVVFDMDGLMFDTERFALEAWIETGKQLGLTVSESLMLETMGRDVDATRTILLDRFGLGVDFNRWRAMRVEHVEKRIARDGIPLKPGLLDLLEYLKEHRYRLAVATSTGQDTAHRHVDMAGLTAYFVEVVSGDKVEHGKPAPDIYVKACEVLSLPPDECMALEDSSAGILSAHRAGMKPVMIPDLLQPDPHTEKHLFAKRSSLFEVIGLLETMRN